MTVKSQPATPIDTIKDPEFKTIMIDGLFGDLNPERGTITFFYDSSDIETIAETGEIRIKKIYRHLILDLRMSPEKWVSIARWMGQQADYYENWRREQVK
ncbi:MAG: hypothetical protein WC382_12355 [Methanoregulaceae archaeon]|jgi:hypothetical protein